MNPLLTEFRDFLKEYKVIGLAVGFVMATATTALVNSLVKDIIMPILSPILATGALTEATVALGPITIAYGAFLSALINFVIIAAIIFIVVKKVMKSES